MHLFLLAVALSAPPEPVHAEFTVEGMKREALFYKPAKEIEGEGGAPVVFGFHGHGGNMQNASRQFHIQTLWPEALVVYMQGIPTPGRLTDPEGKRNGWQHAAGDHGDRDLKFFDAVMERLKKDYKIDESRVYSTGHSNGGGFTYLLWAQRPDVFAAMAPSAAASRSIPNLKPKPAMHIAGTHDELVKYAVQQRAIEGVKQINGCAEKGEEWDKNCLKYASSKDAPFVTFIHEGTHKYPEEAPALIVKFFKEHKKKSTVAKP